MRSPAALLKRGFVEERDVTDGDAPDHIDGERKTGVFITAAGTAAIGIEDEPEVPLAPVMKVERITKAAAVLALLGRRDGATLEELANVHATLEQQIFHVPQGQREPHVHHHHQADHLGRGVETD